jgi:hypothetical protein
MSKCKSEKEDVNVVLIEHDDYSVIYRFNHEGTTYIFKAYRSGKNYRAGLLYPSMPLNKEAILYRKAEAAGEKALADLGLLKRHLGAKLFSWAIFLTSVVYMTALCIAPIEINGFWNVQLYVALPMIALLNSTLSLGRLYHRNK